MINIFLHLFVIALRGHHIALERSYSGVKWVKLGSDCKFHEIPHASMTNSSLNF